MLLCCHAAASCLGVTVLFSLLNQPNQEVLLKCKCSERGGFFLEKQFHFTVWSQWAERADHMTLFTLISKGNVCAWLFWSVSRPGSGFREVRAISTVQLRRLFCSSDRGEGTGQSAAAAATAAGGSGDDVMMFSHHPSPRLCSPSSLSAIG